MNSRLALKIVWILTSWLLQKPADLDLHCLQEKPADQDPYCLQELIYIWFHTVFEGINCLSTVRYKLICSFGQVTFSMDKYILAFYLSLDKWQILLFPQPCGMTIFLNDYLLHTISNYTDKQIIQSASISIT